MYFLPLFSFFAFFNAMRIFRFWDRSFRMVFDVFFRTFRGCFGFCLASRMPHSSINMLRTEFVNESMRVLMSRDCMFRFVYCVPSCFVMRVLMCDQDLVSLVLGSLIRGSLSNEVYAVGLDIDCCVGIDLAGTL